MSISDDAYAFVKKNKKQICLKFANLDAYPPSKNPFTIFMAGSPGAGKTEFSITLIEELSSRDKNTKIVRIDADEVKNEIPQFTGKNSDEVKRATIKIVEHLFDYTHHNDQNVIVDGTFANYDISYSDVQRALSKKRDVGIVYLYQDPGIAWEFTKKREKLEGRTIPKDFFVESFFNAKENVNRIKSDLGKKIRLSLVIKNFENKVEKTHFNIDNVDSYLKIRYNHLSLKAALS